VIDTGWLTPEVVRFVEPGRERVHIARPAEVAKVIAYLASVRGRLITANVIHLRYLLTDTDIRPHR
jgi:hypothetical protein